MLPLNIYCPLLNPLTTSGQRWWLWDLPVESITDCQLQSLTPWIRTSFMLRPCFLWVATNQWMNRAGVLVLARPYLAWDCSNGQTCLRTPHWLSNYDLTVSVPGVFSLSCHGGLTCIMIWRPPCSLSVPDPSFSIHHKYLPQYIFCISGPIMASAPQRTKSRTPSWHLLKSVFTSQYPVPILQWQNYFQVIWIWFCLVPSFILFLLHNIISIDTHISLDESDDAWRLNDIFRQINFIYVCRFPKWSPIWFDNYIHMICLNLD